MKLYHGNLRGIPEHLRTRDVCIAAVRVNPFMTDEVPEPLRAALEKRYRRGIWRKIR